MKSSLEISIPLQAGLGSELQAISEKIGGFEKFQSPYRRGWVVNTQPDAHTFCFNF